MKKSLMSGALIIWTRTISPLPDSLPFPATCRFSSSNNRPTFNSLPFYLYPIVCPRCIRLLEFSCTRTFNRAVFGSNNCFFLAVFTRLLSLVPYTSYSRDRHHSPPARTGLSVIGICQLHGHFS